MELFGIDECKLPDSVNMTRLDKRGIDFRREFEGEIDKIIQDDIQNIRKARHDL